MIDATPALGSTCGLLVLKPNLCLIFKPNRRTSWFGNHPGLVLKTSFCLVSRPRVSCSKSSKQSQINIINLSKQHCLEKDSLMVPPSLFHYFQSPISKHFVLLWKILSDCTRSFSYNLQRLGKLFEIDDNTFCPLPYLRATRILVIFALSSCVLITIVYTPWQQLRLYSRSSFSLAILQGEIDCLGRIKHLVV